MLAISTIVSIPASGVGSDRKVSWLPVYLSAQGNAYISVDESKFPSDCMLLPLSIEGNNESLIIRFFRVKSSRSAWKRWNAFDYFCQCIFKAFLMALNETVLTAEWELTLSIWIYFSYVNYISASQRVLFFVADGSNVKIVFWIYADCWLIL